MNQRIEGLHGMGVTDYQKRKYSNLRLVVVDGQTQAPPRHVRKMQSRIDELEQQVELLKLQLEAERKLSLIDPLTGIANRRAFNARLKSEIARGQRNGSPLSLAVWDIDHFKKINDSYGHPFGDDVIRCVAQVIESHLRDSDFTARYGGEEFVSILPDCDAEGARALAEKISHAIELSGSCLNMVGSKLTVSCGVASQQGLDRDETLFKRADDALYRAKVAGRDRVVVEDD